MIMPKLGTAGENVARVELGDANTQTNPRIIVLLLPKSMAVAPASLGRGAYYRQIRSIGGNEGGRSRIVFRK